MKSKVIFVNGAYESLEHRTEFRMAFLPFKSIHRQCDLRMKPFRPTGAHFTQGRHSTVSDRALIFPTPLLSQLQGWPGCQKTLFFIVFLIFFILGSILAQKNTKCKYLSIVPFFCHPGHP